MQDLLKDEKDINYWQLNMSTMSIKGRWSLNKMYIVHKIHHKINSMTLQTSRDCCLNEFRKKKKKSESQSGGGF